MPSHRRAVPPARPRVLPPLAVLGVAAALAVTIGTGHRPQAAAAVPVAAISPADAIRSPSDVAREVASLPDVSRALKALDKPKARADRSSRSQHREPLHRWVRPGVGYLSSPFGYRWGTLHPGIDLAGPYGSAVFAATDGCIESASYDGGYGNRILMRDWDGTETLYGHMSAFVRTSGCVKAGDVIGREGSTGYSTGPHVHFEVHINGTPIDPIPFLTARGVHV